MHRVSVGHPKRPDANSRQGNPPSHRPGVVIFVGIRLPIDMIRAKTALSEER